MTDVRRTMGTLGILVCKLEQPATGIYFGGALVLLTNPSPTFLTFGGDGFLLGDGDVDAYGACGYI